jgi:hypothetical protein
VLAAATTAVDPCFATAAAVWHLSQSDTVAMLLLLLLLPLLLPLLTAAAIAAVLPMAFQSASPGMLVATNATTVALCLVQLLPLSRLALQLCRYCSC